MQKLRSLIAALVLVSPFAANAGLIELLSNGEFESPNIGGADFSLISDSLVDGWACSSGSCEIWREGVFSSPTLGSDGLSTGQHLELNNNAGFQITSQAALVDGDATGTFSFDYWDRTGSGMISYTVNTTSGGTIAGGVIDLLDNAWYNVTIAGLSLFDGDVVSLSFVDTTFNGLGAHIDQVSFLADCQTCSVAVPEPSIIALFGLGLLGLGFARRRKVQS